MLSSSDPITKIFVVTAKENLGPTQAATKALVCTQRGLDGDLYESSWRSKGHRLLCVEKNSSSDHVVTDVLIVKDDEQVPQGYTGIFLTSDTNEKALRKHILCVKGESRHTATRSVTDIVLINRSKGERADPDFFTISHEVNEINITFRVDNINRMNIASIPMTNSSPRSNEMPLQTAGTRTGSTCSSNANTYHGTELSTTPKSPVIGIEGVPFEMNPKLNIAAITNDPFLASIQILSVEDINRKFHYNFNVENEAVRKT